MTTLSSVSRSERYNAFAVAQPVIVSLAFFLMVVALRSIGAFVLRLDERPNVIFSGVLGFLLVLGYLWLLRKPIGSIGLHARNFNKALLIGGLSLLTLYAALYAVQFYRLSLAGETPQLVFGAFDQKTGTIWKANVLQAFLFGLAHLVFPLSSWVSGQAMAGEAVSEAAFLLILTTMGGLGFGYLYYRTGSLWTALFAHLIDNIIGIFFHIQTVSRINAETDILMLASIGFFALVILAWIISKRSNLPTLKPWGTE